MPGNHIRTNARHFPHISESEANSCTCGEAFLVLLGSPVPFSCPQAHGMKNPIMPLSLEARREYQKEAMILTGTAGKKSQAQLDPAGLEKASDDLWEFHTKRGSHQYLCQGWLFLCNFSKELLRQWLSTCGSQRFWGVVK